MKAVNYYIIIEKIKEKPKTIAGLEIMDTVNTDNRYLKGKIKSIGNLVEGVKEGDVVHYDKHAGHGVQYDEKLYYVIRIQDIVIVE